MIWNHVVAHVFPALHGQLITSLMFSLLDLIKPFNVKSCSTQSNFWGSLKDFRHYMLMLHWISGYSDKGDYKWNIGNLVLITNSTCFAPRFSIYFATKYVLIMTTLTNTFLFFLFFFFHFGLEDNAHFLFWLLNEAFFEKKETNVFDIKYT